MQDNSFLIIMGVVVLLGCGVGVLGGGAAIGFWLFRKNKSQSVPAVSYCRRCGAALTPDNRFCEACGQAKEN